MQSTLIKTDTDSCAKAAFLPTSVAKACFLSVDPRPLSLDITPKSLQSHAWRHPLDLSTNSFIARNSPHKYLFRSQLRSLGEQRHLTTARSLADEVSSATQPKRKSSPKKKRATKDLTDESLPYPSSTQSTDASKSDHSISENGVEDSTDQMKAQTEQSTESQANFKSILERESSQLSDLTSRRTTKSVLQENVYWEELMETVDRPSARDMLPRLKPMLPMGVDREAKGVGSLFNYYVSVRQRHPRKIVLSRVGDFYEAFGYDAVLLVQVLNF
jgi:hypothetical protein